MKIIHVEASTFCNARCPLCPRNLYGYNVKGVYPEVHLSAQKLTECLKNFPDREFVYFNGNLGDPMMNPKILDLVDSTACKTSITTNGSIGQKETWIALAKNSTEVTFSIDGLEDTNHLYRQDVSWDNLMKRIKWFIGAGGKAIWKFVVFKHNSHQKALAQQMSKDIGFQNFQLVDHGRNYGPVLDRNANITHWILPEDGTLTPTKYDVSAGIERYKTTHYNFQLEEKKYIISCEHLRYKSVYIDARGRVAPCCYQGFDLPDIPFMTLDSFETLQKSWQTEKCNPVCAQSCGSK